MPNLPSHSTPTGLGSGPESGPALALEPRGPWGMLAESELIVHEGPCADLRGRRQHQMRREPESLDADLPTARLAIVVVSPLRGPSRASSQRERLSGG
jgi:hypothetical protein